MAPLVDHLWQSWLCLIAVALINLLLHRNPARVRLWLWRVAVCKFLLPFALLYFVGRWLGFPVRLADDAAPALLVSWVAGLKSAFAPAQTAALAGGAALAALALLVSVTLGWGLLILRQLRLEQTLARLELAREWHLGEPATRAVGFFKAAFLTGLAIGIVASALLAGAVDDRQHRHAVFVANYHSLRFARLVMTVAAPGMGERTHVFADTRGVLIRNANLQDLIALVFGVNRSAVFTNQMVSELEANPRDYWLISPRYDVRIEGKVHEPARFEPYALHPLVTRMLADRFGLEIHVNGECQSPCGRWDTSRRNR